MDEGGAATGLHDYRFPYAVLHKEKISIGTAYGQFDMWDD